MELRELCTDFEKIKVTLENVMKNLGNKIVWPPRGGTYSAIYGPILVEDIYKTVNLLKPDELACIKSPTLIWNLLMMCINGVRVAKWPKEKRLELCSKLVDLMPLLKEDDYYYENGTNKLKDFSLELSGEVISVQDSRLLKATLWTYIESLYYNLHNIGFEVHGPYNYNDKTYLVYDYSNLHPEIWKEIDFGFDNIRLISEYENLTIKIDAMDNYYGENLTNPTKTFISSKDKTVNISELFNDLEKNTKTLLKITNNFSKPQIFDKVVELSWYAIKPWKDKLNVSWRPPKIEYNQDVVKSFRIADSTKFFDLTQDA